MSIEAYRRELAAVHVTALSANGWIRITRNASGEIAVNIAPGELRRHTERQVEEEIASALEAAFADFDKQYRVIRRRYFGPSMGMLWVPPQVPATERSLS